VKDAGVVFQPGSQVDKERAERAGLQVALPKKRTFDLPWGRTLFVGPGAAVPWDLLMAGFHFIERWDAAVPLWRYGVLAADVGSKDERVRTRGFCLDLRVPLHESALLFVRKSKDGVALMAAFQEELRHGQDERLAFLRALHLVKPICCTLPRSWLAEIRDNRLRGRGHTGARRRMVKMEIGPGRFVKALPGHEERVKREYAQMRTNRGKTRRK
jgi:hypothetical protein